MSSSGKGQEISLSALSVQQLSQLKKQLDEEITHLSTSFQSLRAAQAKFRDCLKTLSPTGPLASPIITITTNSSSPASAEDTDARAALPKGQPILVPLTSSLYVPGILPATATSTDPTTNAGNDDTVSKTTTVLVDVGTGFFVQKNLVDARDFYNRKVAALEANLKDLERIMQGKGQNLAAVEESIRQKVLAGNASAAQGQAQGSAPAATAA